MQLPATAPEAGELIVVAVRDGPEARPSVGGGTARLVYGGQPSYAGSARAFADAERIARDHGLTEQSAWTIVPLRWRCMLYRLPAGADRAAVLARLGADPRVELAEPLNSFETLTTPYNDPYIGLQRGFVAMQAAAAQEWTRGDGVRVALIDTGVDRAHPDLDGRIARERDAVGAAHPPAAEGERHGTEIAGVIAASANNHIGIVGMAPAARLSVYRACWSVADLRTSRCDSYSLAQALSAAITDGADIINLSLGGPSDPLLERLAGYAVRHDIIVVGAAPPSGSLQGFPVDVPGVLAVAALGDPSIDPRALVAPGNDILTLTPGGHYDYASGSSLAAAHVTGVVALLRALQPGLRPDAVRAVLARDGHGIVDACASVKRLRPAALCGETEGRDDGEHVAP